MTPRPSEKARALARTTEALCIASTARSALREAVTRCVEAHHALTRIEHELVGANVLISGPQYVDVCSDCLGTGVDPGEKCNLCRGKSVAA